MNKIYLTVILTLFTINTFAQSNKDKLEEKHGIRDIKLDTPKSKYNDLMPIKTEIQCGQIYQRRNENLIIGGVKVSKIWYLYIDNTLWGIYVFMSSEENARLIAQSFGELYGMPERTTNDDGSGLIYKWEAYSFFVNVNGETMDFIKKDFKQKCTELERRTKNKIKSDL